MIDAAVAALSAGEVVVLPTDTVYGLCVTPYTREPARRLFELKGRERQQAIALVAADLEMLLECVPELRGRSATIARELLPGPYTLIFPNPAQRYGWLTGSRPDTIGVRVPVMEPRQAGARPRLRGRRDEREPPRRPGPEGDR